MNPFRFASVAPLCRVAILVLPTLVACNTQWIREVRRTPAGGEVALVRQSEDAQAQAQQLMAARCPQGYDILEEGETVVGQNVSANTVQRPTIFFGPVVSTTQSSEDRREWRIKYQCKGAPQAPATQPAVVGARATHEIVIY
jgi:hypothetical protein